MAILEKEVKIPINAKHLEYYKSKGYDIPYYVDRKKKIRVKNGTEINIKINDLLHNNSIKVTKICDNCLKSIPNVYFFSLMKSRGKNDGKDLCKSCSSKYHGELKRNSVPYENSAEFYCKNNNLTHLINLFSTKNSKHLNSISRGSAEECMWNCSIFGEEHEHSMRLINKINSPNSCPYCTGNKVNHTNCLWTTHPEIAKLLLNYEDGFNYSYGSGRRLDFKCYDCGELIKKKKLNNIIRNGLSCPKCGDGLSYPEKFMYNVLDQLDIDFEYHKTFDWSQNKEYDFYLPYLNCIIEVHGNQHYEGSFSSCKGGKTLKEEQENDILKEKLAKENGIKNYIIINARESNIEYIKNNINNSNLALFFNFDMIDWKTCHMYACKSIVKNVAELWNSVQNANEISKILRICKESTIRYLKQATKIGWCDYDAKLERTKNAYIQSQKIMRPVVQISLNGEFVNEYRSIRNAAETLGVDHATIGRVLNPKYRNKTGAGYKWMYKEDYDQYIKQAN